MTDGQDYPRTLSTAIPAIPLPTEVSQPGKPEEEARGRIATLEREARALGADPRAALLFHEIGLLWESPLKHPRHAAVAYQAAYKLAPRFLANIRAARRLFSEVGNWMMVLQLLEAELLASDTPRARAALLFEKAQILEQRLSREDEALAGYAECLKLEPQDVSLLAQLEQIFAERGDHTQVVAVQRLLAKVVTDDGARAHYLTAAGLLLEDRLKDFTGAAVCFREAFKLDRRDPLLLAAIKRLAQREGTVEEELAALAAEAEAQGAMAAPTFLQISKAYERLARPEDALAALVAARRVAPTDPLILSELSRIYETQGRHEELADALLAWVACITDASEVVAINLRLAALYEEQLKRDADAIGRFQAILEKSKGHPTALAGLGKLYHRAQNWQGLLDTFDAEIAALDDARQKAGRVYKSAEVLEERLGRTEEAIARYNQCLQLQPGYLPAQKALTRLYEKLGRFHELITMFEQELLQATDVEQQVTTLHRIAGIYEERLDDLPHAIESLKRVLEVSPEHLATVRNLARLYEAADQWKELIELHEQETTLTGDTKHVISLVHRIAEILEEQLKDRPAAIAAYERVLQLAPTYLPALKALGRLYGQTAQWEPLVRMFKAEAEIAPSTDEAASLTYRIGELYEHKLKLENDAIIAYQEVLTLAPTYFPAVRALARIYRAQGAWESLIEVLRTEAANRTDPLERANAIFQAASIWEDQLKRPQDAIVGYQEVLRLSPTHPSALQQLERLLTQSDALQELILVLDRQTQSGTPGMKLAASLKLARLYLDRLNEPSRAASCCEAALGVDPSNLSALKLLERIRSGDKPQRNALRARLAQTLGDTKLSAALTLAAAESGIDATGRASAQVLGQLKAAWQQDPADESLGSMLERALQRSGDAAGLAALYERRLTGAPELADRVQLNLRLGELHEGRLNDPGKAARAYTQALELQPALLPALRGLARAQAKMGNPAKAREVIEQLAAAAVDPQTATEALLEAAGLARAAGDSVGASALYGKVLEKNPLHPQAGAGLEEILAERGGSGDLAQMHERRGEARLSAKDPTAAAAEFLSAARVYLDTLKDKPRAAGLLAKVLLAEPANVEALELKGDLALEAQDYLEAAAAYAVRVQQGGESRHLSALNLKLGALYQDHVGDPARAAAHLGTVLSTEPQNVEALQRLATIHTASKNWTGAADCLRQLLELVTAPQDRARHTLALARIVDEGFADAAQASTLYRQALELLPGDTATLDRLVALYERSGSLAELVVVLEQQANHAPDVKRMVALKLRVGELYAKNLGNAPKALATYKGVLEADASNLAAHVALADLYTKDPGLPSMAIEAHRALLKLEPARVDSLHTLFRLWEGLRQYDKAFCAAGVLTFLRAQTEMEGAFYTEGKNRLPQLAAQLLTPADLLALHHPAARNALVDVLRAVGDQLTKVHPPNLEALGIDRRADRLKADHAVSKAVRAVASLVGAEEYEVYQAKRGWVTLETTEPLGVCVGQDLVRRTNAEQRFLLGRAALGLLDKTAVLRKLSTGEAADLIGNSVRIHRPNYAALGRRSDEQSKALRRAYSRRALKLLEEPADAVAQLPNLNLDTTLEGLALSADRTGLLFCGDVAAGLGLMLKEEQPASVSRVETPESVAAQVTARRDLRELLGFAVSDDLFRLRQRLQLSLG